MDYGVFLIITGFPDMGLVIFDKGPGQVLMHTHFEV